MENRLALCLQQLKEVEAQLLELNKSPAGDSAVDSRASEALAFVQEAITAVRGSRRAVAGLPASATRIESKGTAGGT